MKLNMKIITFLLVLFIVSSGSLLTAVISSQRTDQHFRDFVYGEVQLYSQIQQVQVLGLQRGQAVRDLLMWPYDSIATKNFQQSVSDSLSIFDTLVPLAKKYGLEKEILDIKDFTLKDIDLQKTAVTKIQTKKDDAIELITDEETPVWRVVKAKILTVQSNVLKMFDDKIKNIHQQDLQNIHILEWLFGLFVVTILLIYFYISRYVTKPILAINRNLVQIADKNLRVASLHVPNHDEMGQLAGNVNRMVMSLQQLIHQIQSASAQVADSAAGLSVNTSEISIETEQISEFMQTVAEGTEHQLREVEESLQAMQDLSTGIAHILESSMAASDDSVTSAAEANQGQEMMSKVEEQMSSIQTSANESSELISTLKQRAQEVGQIVDVIAGISAQTNLLSLNAALEAARAGAQGRGFAVVADEVRKLSQQTAESAKQIADIIHAIQTDTSKAADSMSKELNEVNSGITVVQDTREVFTRILHAVQQTVERNKEVSSWTEQMSSGSSQAAASLADMSQTSKQASSIVQKVALSSEKQTASVQEIAASASSLTHAAAQLQEQISLFKL